MHFEILGPHQIETPSILKTDDIKSLKKRIEGEEGNDLLFSSCGCYLFGIKTSGSKSVTPWYVGKSEQQSVFSEATNAAHLQLYNEILDRFKKGIPVFYFLPATTPTGKAKTPTNGDKKMTTVAFLEDWLIASALKANPNLWNIRGTKLLRELYVRGIFNPTKGDQNLSSKSLKECLKL